jgi:hypothetical protein
VRVYHPVDAIRPLAGNRPAPPPPGRRLPMEPLSESELGVLRYLPTNLTGPEVAGEPAMGRQSAEGVEPLRVRSG